MNKVEAEPRRLGFQTGWSERAIALEVVLLSDFGGEVSLAREERMLWLVVTFWDRVGGTNVWWFLKDSQDPSAIVVLHILLRIQI